MIFKTKVPVLKTEKVQAIGKKMYNPEGKAIGIIIDQEELFLKKENNIIPDNMKLVALTIEVDESDLKDHDQKCKLFFDSIVKGGSKNG